ncbi:hypothetical protein [Agromyces sp. NBRC 114283]|uniref:hypothetical protein n=1 Tax=Agromyces sp. NBRC 114283 TaxID=2994521 RepID=UPI0024A4909A|nr:hypothetical protein [Agromyces sp. NBRC 114283]GLU90933.1 hypothetical protein Agsp01_31880 [Agromyces sp. NBRC 114283]
MNVVGLVVLGLVFAFAAAMGWLELRGSRTEGRRSVPRPRADRVEAGLRAAGFADDEVAYALSDLDPELVRVRTSQLGPVVILDAPDHGVRVRGLRSTSVERRARQLIARRTGIDPRAILFDELD